MLRFDRVLDIIAESLRLYWPNGFAYIITTSARLICICFITLDAGPSRCSGAPIGINKREKNYFIFAITQRISDQTVYTIFRANYVTRYTLCLSWVIRFNTMQITFYLDDCWRPAQSPTLMDMSNSENCIESHFEWSRTGCYIL